MNLAKLDESYEFIPHAFEKNTETFQQISESELPFSIDLPEEF